MNNMNNKMDFIVFYCFPDFFSFFAIVGIVQRATENILRIVEHCFSQFFLFSRLGITDKYASLSRVAMQIIKIK